jgi:PEP-CTERM motif
VDLTFTTLFTANYPGYNGLDEIYFSNIPVPEPSTLFVFALGGFVLLSFRHRRK